MQLVVSLILLWACLTADAENEGPSDYLKSKWRTGYLIINHHNTSRCFRTCSPNEDDIYWNDTVLKGPASLPESGYMAFLTSLYTNDRDEFIMRIRNISEIGIKYLDVDQNSYISAEEFYTEHLCLGFTLGHIRKIFNALNPMDIGIPNSEIVEYFVQTWTGDNRPDAISDEWKETIAD